MTTARTRSALLSLPSLTRRLIDTAAAGASVTLAMRRLAPWLVDQLERDAGCAALHSLWGTSRNCDEHAQRPIVNQALLAAIGGFADVAMDAAIVHAGVMHTYGYLLSNLRTPHGFKRARYTRPAMAIGLGIAPNVLRPQPRAGTLLANLTWALGTIAFAPGSAERGRLEELRARVAPQLAAWIPRGARETLVETVHLRQRGRAAQADIITQLVPMRGARGASHVLIYSLRWTTAVTLRQQLLTAFPVARAAVRDLRRLAASTEPIRLRFNAHHPALSGRDLTGRRRLYLQQGRQPAAAPR